MRLMQKRSGTAHRRWSRQRAIGWFLVLAMAVVVAACSAPALETLPLVPEEKHHVLLLNQEVTVTFTNRTTAAVSVAGWEWGTRGQGIFNLREQDCIVRSPIAAGGTCRATIKKIANGNVNVYLYLGNASRRPMGGVIVR